MDPIYYMVHQETDAHGKVQVQGHKLKETVQLTDKGIQSQVFSKQLVKCILLDVPINVEVIKVGH